jgi:hypothetical protein
VARSSSVSLYLYRKDRNAIGKAFEVRNRNAVIAVPIERNLHESSISDARLDSREVRSSVSDQIHVCTIPDPVQGFCWNRNAVRTGGKGEIRRH